MRCFLRPGHESPTASLPPHSIGVSCHKVIQIQESPHLKIFNLILSAKSLLPSKVRSLGGYPHLLQSELGFRFPKCLCLLAYMPSLENTRNQCLHPDKPQYPPTRNVINVTIIRFSCTVSCTSLGPLSFQADAVIHMSRDTVQITLVGREGWSLGTSY